MSKRSQQKLAMINPKFDFSDEQLLDMWETNR